MLEFTYLEDSRARYEMLLRDAEAERLAIRVQQSRQSKEGSSILLHMGNWLIDTGSWLKQRAQLEPSLS